MTPPAWTDIEADLDMAARHAVRASASAALLAEREGIDRESYGLAIGKHLHEGA